MDIKPKLIILSGPPASGKTTKARERYKQHRDNGETVVIISMDAFRHATGDYWVEELNPYIYDLEYYAVRSALSRNYTVIIDDTNLNPMQVAKWYLLANEFNIYVCDVEHIELKTSYEQCCLNDKNPDRDHHVGEDVIKRFFDKYKL